MNVDALFSLLTAARKLCGHSEYVIVGSLSVLGMSEVSAIPRDMTMSIDADCYTLADPGRAFDLKPQLGEGSPFHQAHGIYLDPVSPRLPTLPDGWGQRLIRLERRNVVAHFLEPHDAAVSKLARGEPRDSRWVLAGAKAGILSLPTIALRFKSTSFYDGDEQVAAMALLEKIKRRLAA